MIAMFATLYRRQADCYHLNLFEIDRDRHR